MLNHEGACVAACSEPMRGALSPELAEALALRLAVHLAQEVGFDDIIFNTDCLSDAALGLSCQGSFGGSCGFPACSSALQCFSSCLS